MNIPEIAHKYRISEAFLNSKDDALVIASDSLRELQTYIRATSDNNELVDKLQYLIDFMLDVKQATY